MPRGPGVTTTAQSSCRAGRGPAQVLCCLVSGVPWISPHRCQEPGGREWTSLLGTGRVGGALVVQGRARHWVQKDGGREE